MMCTAFRRRMVFGGCIPTRELQVPGAPPKSTHEDWLCGVFPTLVGVQYLCEIAMLGLFGVKSNAWGNSLGGAYCDSRRGPPRRVPAMPAREGCPETYVYPQRERKRSKKREKGLLLQLEF